MSHRIGDTTYTTEEIDALLSGTHSDLSGLSSNEFGELQEAALDIKEAIDRGE